MKKIFLTSLLLSSLVTANSLHIEVSSLKNKTGKLRIGLFNTSVSYTNNTKPYQGVVLSISNKKVKHHFKNIPKGTYAVAILHDENSNGRLDKNMLGIPTEGYGFSNNAKAIFSAPSFEKTKFTLDTNKKLLIKMDY